MSMLLLLNDKYVPERMGAMDYQHSSIKMSPQSIEIGLIHRNFFPMRPKGADIRLQLNAQCDCKTPLLPTLKSTRSLSM